MKYFIKNIISSHSRYVVIKHLEAFGIPYNWIGSCIVELTEKIPADAEQSFVTELDKSGLKLEKNKKNVLIEDIKSIIDKRLSAGGEYANNNFSLYLSKELGYHYTYLTNVFSEDQGITIKQYIIAQKIGRIKKMILNEGLSLKQIASVMQYKRVSHLSNQFKKITGISPSHFKKNK